MPELTLARFILEFSLMNYDLITVSDSKLAAACLYMALRMNKKTGWNKTLQYYSGDFSRNINQSIIEYLVGGFLVNCLNLLLFFFFLPLSFPETFSRTGYMLDEFKEIVPMLNDPLHRKQYDANKTIRNKYTHKLFYEVSKTPLLTNEQLFDGAEAIETL